MNEDIRIVAHKAQTAVTGEWDLIAPERDAQVAGNHDASFTRVLEPWVLDRTRGARNIIDVGCGTGRLTSKLHLRAETVVGIDPSSVSIDIAQSHDDGTRYAVASAEQWAAQHPDAEIDLVVANMVLMDALHLDSFIAAIARIARKGRILATMTHPTFWPIYWGYATNPGFDYLTEAVIEAPFKTSSHEFGLIATHVHRPLSTYLQAFRTNGLKVTHLQELRGPEPRVTFPFPRFIGIEAVVE
ncbi:bifunctional 2-polyprenyl-6-hydroxyphenol methylase/3-demethylubiquinol 3-O-methyltransferase UbiG [Microbacterium sp. SORGH_AS_0969]|uniref:class I SAM-dependent methyltransferase n=1 Tax=Microbacterium sp. SORGH_AS_0969 TaxID=3041793 RepID=UPI002783E489|nr:class I SAM-dependent methyltransferase [Microbacterium sp. SORGH_AS_0969]MDQ1075040.1 trans-aconitate methyltransferase [Microbacterium sp. SORGH_AS_0969]